MSRDNNGNDHDPLTGRFVSKPLSDDDLDTDFFSLEREQCLKLAKRREIDLLWRASNIEVAVTFPETEQIFEGTAPYGVERRKVQVVNNLKHCWQFLFDNADWPVDWQYLSQYNRLAGDGLETDPGMLRNTGVRISGTDYVPAIPTAEGVREAIAADMSLRDAEDKAIGLFCDISRGQWFSNGNKRTAIMAANHTLIHEGAGLFSLPPELMTSEFRGLLIDFYETNDRKRISDWLKRNAIGRMPDGLTEVQRDSNLVAPGARTCRADR